MRKIFFAIFLLIATTSFSQTPTDPRLKGLDTFALRILKEWDAPGVTIAVVEKNKVIYINRFLSQYTGVPPEAFTKPLWISRIHPDDRHEVLKKLP